MSSFERRVSVAFGQCDPAGIVYYPNYFDMFNASTDAMVCAALEVHPRDLTRIYDIIGIPMVDARNIYHRPSRHGDALRIESRVVAIGRSSFRVEHRLYTEDGDLGVEGFETRVWAATDPDNPARLKGKTIPDAVRVAFMTM